MSDGSAPTTTGAGGASKREGLLAILGNRAPAVGRSVGLLREVGRGHRAGRDAGACEHQQVGHEVAHPVDLAQRELRLGIGRRAGRERLEPEPEPRERRAHLVRRVRDELALGVEERPSARPPCGSARRRPPATSGGPAASARAARSPCPEPLRGARERVQRPRERRRQAPCDGEADDRDHRRHGGDRLPAPPHAGVDRGHRLGEAHRPDHLPVGEHGRGHHEQVAAQVDAVADQAHRLAVERRRDLGSAGRVVGDLRRPAVGVVASRPAGSA